MNQPSSSNIITIQSCTTISFICTSSWYRSSILSSHLLCFFANRRFLKNFGSTPLSEGYLLRGGFLIPLRWFFTLWLRAVWFFDLAIAQSACLLHLKGIVPNTYNYTLISVTICSLIFFICPH